ncbi:3-hydroxyacyl-ACP dehydratase [Rhodoferax sp.]|uniref:3-hydroxyacyl-ACP dehydratase n=1 Tax=Rhodoferax sp. TaxID=50421 RepID=UPI0027640987|nr:3-hydroxyacyl-ACP dehydratase [Rhodoferax sp.]
MPSLPIRIATDHPAFSGHFPGRPIVPGVLLLDTAVGHVESATGLTASGLASAKFLSPALPGEALWLDFEVDGCVVRFDIRCGQHLVATGRLNMAGAAPA